MMSSDHLGFSTNPICEKLKNIADADYLLVHIRNDTSLKLKTTTQLGYWLERFTGFFTGSKAASPEWIERGVIQLLQSCEGSLPTNQDLVNSITKIAAKCELLVGDKNSEDKHTALNDAVNKIMTKLNEAPTPFATISSPLSEDTDDGNLPLKSANSWTSSPSTSEFISDIHNE